MVLPDMEISVDLRLFMSLAIKVDPRYCRIEVAVYPEEIHEPNIAMMKTTLMQYYLDRETPPGEPPSDALLREIFGLSEPQPDLRLAMKIISWNCQGAGKQAFATHCLGLKLIYHPHVMVIMESKVSFKRADRIIFTLGFPNHFCVTFVGFAGRLWVLWGSTQVHVNILVFSRQAVHALISFNNKGEWLSSAAYVSPIPSV